MESKYWLEITEDRAGYRLFDGQEEKIRAAIDRIQSRIRKGGTIQGVFIKNPRYSGN